MASLEPPRVHGFHARHPGFPQRARLDSFRTFSQSPTMAQNHTVLQNFVDQLNGLAFWSEFSFNNTQFTPPASSELELADSLVWFSRFAIAFQLKERDADSGDAQTEKNWFDNTVIKRGTRQIRDTMRYLQENPKITVTNQRGHAFDIEGANIDDLLKVVVYGGSKTLPEECWNTRYYESRTGGFIHVLAAHDYMGILEKLRVPEDIRRYFAYREAALRAQAQNGGAFQEHDIMGAYVSDQAMPDANSHKALAAFIQDTENFDLSPIIGNLHKQIERQQNPYDYYRIMQEFAVLPRSMWREILIRFRLSLKATEARAFEQPYLLAYPASDCAFMICPLHPEAPVTGAESERIRIDALQKFTDAAMYFTKMSKGVGLMMSKDGEFHQWDWMLIDLPWAYHAGMEETLAANNPFRATREANLPSFLFVADE